MGDSLQADRMSDRAAYKRAWYLAHKASHYVSILRWKNNNYTKVLFQKARQRARRKSVEFTILYDEVTWPTHCPVLGVKLDYSVGTKNRRSFGSSPSLDRMVPAKGYVRGNVYVISHRANMIKSNATAEELQKVADWVRLFT